MGKHLAVPLLAALPQAGCALTLPLCTVPAPAATGSKPGFRVGVVPDPHVLSLRERMALGAAGSMASRWERRRGAAILPEGSMRLHLTDFCFRRACSCRLVVQPLAETEVDVAELVDEGLLTQADATGGCCMPRQPCSASLLQHGAGCCMARILRAGHACLPCQLEPSIRGLHSTAGPKQRRLPPTSHCHLQTAGCWW